MKHNKEIIFVSVFILVVIISSSFLWSEIAKNSDDIQDKFKSTDATGHMGNRQSVAGAKTALPQTKDAARLNSGESLETMEQKSSDSIEQETVRSKEKIAEVEDLGSSTDKNDWLKYQNKKLDVEFKYPSGILIDTNQDMIKIAKDNKYWKIRLYKNEKEDNIDAWYLAQFSEKERKNCVLTGADLKVGTYETRYVDPKNSSQDCDKSGYFASISDKKKIVRVEIEKTNELFDEAKKILETLKFDD